jgi:DNA-binding transcriptional MerR regulator
MNKSPEAFRTISEVADALDVPPHVLRFWETRFTQVKPVKRGGGRRYYRPEDVRLLRGIRGLLYDDGMTIKGVQKILRERGIRHVIGLGTLPADIEVAEEVAPVAAPAPAPVEKPRPALSARPSVPQRDLFDAGAAVSPSSGPASGAAVETVERPVVAAASGSAKPLDKAALRKLVAELKALRAAMIEEPGR